MERFARKDPNMTYWKQWSAVRDFATGYSSFFLMGFPYIPKFDSFLENSTNIIISNCHGSSPNYKTSL